MATLFRHLPGACILLACFLSAQPSPWPVALADLVRPGDPLKDQDLRFDGSHASLALAYLKSGDPALIRTMASLPAIEHLLRHARRFDYDVPKDSSEALAAHLVDVRPERRDEAASVCARSLAYFSGPMLQDPGWVNDVLRYLPEDFRFHGTLFLTFNYDIGVAEGHTASVNGAFKGFKEHPREVLYYAIHELHHTGFMSYHMIPPIAQWKTHADLLRWVDYATQLEGMAVWAAYARRKQDGALAEDPAGDYVALEDPATMERLENAYFQAYEALKARGDEPADAKGREAVFKTFSAERLWYRVGAHMARRIEAERGRSYLASLVKAGPTAFLEAYRLKAPHDE